MIITTKHGDFEVRDITRKERRKHYRKVKDVFASGDMLLLHDLVDDFTAFAFKDPDKSLEGLTALQEDEVLMEVIST